LYTCIEPLQLAVKPLDEPQVAVALTLLYLPPAGLLQFGALDQLMPVAVFPLLQVKVGGVIAVPETPLAGTEPQVSVALTASEPLQLAVKLLDVPQSAVTLTLLYVPCAGLLQVGALSDQLTLAGVSPLLQVKTGGAIATSEMPLAGTVPQASFTGSTVNVPLQPAVFVAVPQVAVAAMSLYAPGAGLLQFGAFADHAASVAASPFLQVRTGSVTATPETPLAGTEPQTRTGSTVSVPLQLALLIAVPQVATALMSLYVPSAGLLQFGAFVQAGMPGVPWLQVKAGGLIPMLSYPEADTAPQASVTGLTVNEPQEILGKVPCPQSASASTS
jgi:hypothetical protein